MLFDVGGARSKRCLPSCLLAENYNQERELLLKEIANLKKQKNVVEEDLINKSVELARTKDNLEKHHLESTHSSAYFSKIENQVRRVRR